MTHKSLNSNEESDLFLKNNKFSTLRKNIEINEHFKAYNTQWNCHFVSD